MDHLLFSCVVMRLVWQKLYRMLNILKCWGVVSFEQSLFLWFFGGPAWYPLPIFVSWAIWRHINLVIFENHVVSFFKLFDLPLAIPGRVSL